MECTIENYKFVLTDSQTISVYQKNGLNIFTTFKPADEIKDQKSFDIECSDWYLKHIRI